MAEHSKIEWTDATWNPITGCTLVNDGCKHCYAAHLIVNWPAIGNHPSRKGLARVNAQGEAKFTGEVRFNEQWLGQPIRWRKPRKIFVCAHGDLFHESVPDEWIDRIFAVMALCPQHIFQVLTKRPERAQAYLTGHAVAARVLPTAELARGSVAAMRNLWPLPNVWLGTSVSDQITADTMIPHLLATHAAVRFLSVEPMLGPVDLTWAFPDRRTSCCQKCGFRTNQTGGICPNDGTPMRGDIGIDWVICGGESGPKARPMHPQWARDLRDQCSAAGTRFFMKQMGGKRKPFDPIPDDLMVREFPNG